MPPPRAVVAVAFSGGPDSTALLHATARAAAALGIEVVALHVHHGLMAEADAWAEHALAFAGGLGVRARVRRLTGRPGRGDSVEAWARRERYAALSAMALEEGASLVLLAQHRRDQAETVLLQMLRGAGPAGLAAMPAHTVDDGLVWARPWLEAPRTAIAAYLRMHRLPTVGDPSNADPRFARARLRTQVWPALTAAFADAEVALAGVARRAQEAAAVLDEVAQEDLAGLEHDGALDQRAWLKLSSARRTHALRAWLARHLDRGVPQALLQRLEVELPVARSARWPAGERVACRLYRGRLKVVPEASGPPSSGPAQAMDLSRPGRYPVPGWPGQLVVTRVARGGVPASWLREAVLHGRRGGERFRLAERGMARSLKKQYQAVAVPEEGRAGPLVYVGDRLLFVPGLGLDAAACAEPGQPRRSLRWEPDA